MGDDVIQDPRLDLLAVKVFLRLVPRTKVVIYRTNLLSLISAPRKILKESTEGSGTSTEASHYKWLLKTSWQLTLLLTGLLQRIFLTVRTFITLGLIDTVTF